MKPLQVLVSDTSVLIDLERGSLLNATFRLPYEFAVPDLLYRQELQNWNGEELRKLGLSVQVLDGNGVSRALAYRRQAPALSLPDCFALALAQTQSWILLSGDTDLRHLAATQAVECHGVLWILDEMRVAAAASIRELHSGLSAMAAHPRCRLPQAEIRRRLNSYARHLSHLS